MATRSDDGKRWEQRAVAAEILTPGLPKPNILLGHEDGSKFGVWFIDVVDLREGELPDEMSNAAPVPGYGGWRIAEGGDHTPHSVDVLRSLLVPAPTPGTPRKMGELEIIDEDRIDPALLDREIEISISPFGKKTQPGRWRAKKMTVRQLIANILKQHKLGEK